MPDTLESYRLVCRRGEHEWPQLAFRDERGYARLHADQGLASVIGSDDGSGTLDDALKELQGSHDIWPATHLPGEYHPRIFRDGWFPAIDAAACRSAGIQLSLLLDQLWVLFRVVAPSVTNSGSHGHAFRNILILCCTEIESAWRGVLQANGYERERFSTRDYVKLAPRMRLRERRFELISYPEFGEIAPFASWDAQNPTTSLAWYDAYNAVKHDREAEMHRATLGHTIAAMAGLFAMLVAQFGAEPLSQYVGASFRGFRQTRRVNWAPTEAYFQARPQGSIRPKLLYDGSGQPTCGECEAIERRGGLESV